MSELFDIEFVTQSFGSCDLGYYIKLIENASTNDLREFRGLVRDHAKRSRTIRAFANVPGLTSHAALVAAIDHQILKRAPLKFKLWSLLVPVRQFLVAKFSGLQLEGNESFGAIYTTPTRRRTIWHMPHKEMAAVMGRFLAEHRKAIIASILAITTAAIIKWLAL